MIRNSCPGYPWFAGQRAVHHRVVDTHRDRDTSIAPLCELLYKNQIAWYKTYRKDLSSVVEWGPIPDVGFP